MDRFKFGVSSVLFKHENLETALNLLNQLNEKIIDLVFAPPVFCPHYNPLKSSTEDNAKLKELLSRYSFNVSSLNIVPGKLNAGDVEKTSKFIVKSIELCNFLGVKVLTIPSGAKVKEFEWTDNVKAIGKKLAELLVIAKDNGVSLSVEAPHGNSITESIEEVVRFYEIINLPDLRLTFDTSHARLFHKYDITEAYKKIGDGRINHIHLRDTFKGSINLTPGTGTCDFRKFFKYLSDIKYNGYAVYELEYHGLTNSRIFEEIKFAKQYVNNIINDENIDFGLRIKTNKYYNILKRFEQHPKEELSRHPKLFNFIRTLADPVMRLRPDNVYHGYYKKELRSFKGKITNLKSNSLSISSDRVINVGIIGLGRVGLRWHAAGLGSIKEVNIIGGYDIDPEKNLLFSKKYNTKNFLY